MFIPNASTVKQAQLLAPLPQFIACEKTLIAKITALRNAFDKSSADFFYAMKANYNPHIIDCLKNNGLNGIDAVSLFEVQHALSLGFLPEQIIYTACASSNAELQTMHDLGVYMNLGSLSELDFWGQNFASTPISIRINPGFGEGEHAKVITAGDDSKFGIHLDHLPQVFELIQQYNMHINGLHCHIGSGLYKAATLDNTLKQLLPTIQSFPNLDILNLGGGFGVSYFQTQTSIDLHAFAQCLDTFLTDHHLQHLKIRFEPGKFLVSESTALICQVLRIKTHNNKQTLILNTGFNHLIRPAMYDSQHEIVHCKSLDKTSSEQNLIATDIHGYLCESGDVFAQGIDFPQCQEGDVIAILGCGGYGSSMSSLYNFRPFATESILKANGEIALTRKSADFETCQKQMSYVF